MLMKMLALWVRIRTREGACFEADKMKGRAPFESAALNKIDQFKKAASLSGGIPRELASRASILARSASFSSRALMAISRTASNSSRLTTSRLFSQRSACAWKALLHFLADALEPHLRHRSSASRIHSKMRLVPVVLMARVLVFIRRDLMLDPVLTFQVGTHSVPLQAKTGSSGAVTLLLTVIKASKNRLDRFSFNRHFARRES